MFPLVTPFFSSSPSLGELHHFDIATLFAGQRLDMLDKTPSA
jgi:hypothetical protein